MKNCKSNNNAKIIDGLEETISYLRTRTSEVSERCIQYQQEAIATLKEQEEKTLLCDKCSYHREDGWCGMNGQWVNETDYCSLGAWESW